MILSDLGKKTTTYSADKKSKLAKELRQGKKDVIKYMHGVCYDAVAYVVYLEGKGISTAELESIYSEGWVSKLKFEREWDGTSNMPEGEGVGFYRLVDKKYFHAALCVGGTIIRAINGTRLGASWLHPVDLKILGRRNPDGTFNYDHTEIRVLISTL